MRREVPMRAPIDAQTRAWFLVVAFLCALYGAAGFGLGALVFHSEPTADHRDVKPANAIQHRTGADDANVIPKASGGELQNSAITLNADVLTIGNTLDHGYLHLTLTPALTAPSLFHFTTTEAWSRVHYLDGTPVK